MSNNKNNNNNNNFENFSLEDFYSWDEEKALDFLEECELSQHFPEVLAREFLDNFSTDIPNIYMERADEDASL